MKQADQGAAVVTLQGDLTSIGILTTRDGVFGPKTVESVKKFQKKYGLKADGVAGPVTLSMIAQVKGGAIGKSDRTFGIDVSGWQPGTDWKKVAAAGVKFAFIKATEHTSYVNPLYKLDYTEAKGNGILVGSYHFFRPQYNGKEQATHYLTNIRGFNAPDDLPLVLDLEVANVAPSEIIKQSVLFLNELEQATGKKPIIYTNPATINYCGNPAAFAAYPLWIAAPERQSVPALKPWGSNWTFWQYTFKGQYAGTTGQDGNYFNGSLAELNAFAQSSVMAPVVEPKPVFAQPAEVLSTDAPWMNWMKQHEGMNESNNSRELADLVWGHTTYALGQKSHTVSGKAFSWCAATVNAALENSGFKGNRSAAAISFQNFGKPCDFKFGAILPMQHKTGAHHVTFFHHWVNEKKKLAACFGGNQSNALRISTYDLSGNKKGADEIVPCPRWPVTKA